MIAAAILAITIAKPQTVTFSHPCANAAVVLEALGKELGITIKPLASVNQDYFLVSFTDVPQEDAFAKIASTLNATWEDREGVKYLTRTHAQELEEERQEREIDVKVISDWLAKRQIKEEYTANYAKKLIEQVLPLMDASSQSGGENYQQLMSFSADSPLERLLTRLLHEIGAK